ncbi:GW dipeptide domain-containing protein [Actinomadura citrea]|uniref:GW dipeptide domain-containing protein n=1 Tax=Actinomadura citrea TaxID=46158 RepID=UPI003CE49858
MSCVPFTPHLRGVACVTVGIAASMALLSGPAQAAGSPAAPVARPATAPITKLAVKPAAKPAAKRKTKWVLQLRYRITKPCRIFFNDPSRTTGANKSWTLTPRKSHKGKPTTVKWRYNSDRKWAVVSVGGHGYPHWGYTDRTKKGTCLGTSIRQAERVALDPKTKKWVPVSYYPAGRPVPSRLHYGRSGKVGATKQHVGWRKVDQSPSGAKIVRRVATDENATLRDKANFVIGNVPKGWRIGLTHSTRQNGHWTKVRVPKLKRWGYIETRALPGHSTPLQSGAAPAPAAAAQVSTPAPVTPACHWKIIWPAAGVYPTAARTTAPLKVKHAGDTVGQSCATAHNTAENQTYVQVILADGGTGWMRRNALRPA